MYLLTVTDLVAQDIECEGDKEYRHYYEQKIPLDKIEHVYFEEGMTEGEIELYGAPYHTDELVSPSNDVIGINRIPDDMYWRHYGYVLHSYDDIYLCEDNGHIIKCYRYNRQNISHNSEFKLFFEWFKGFIEERSKGC